MLSWTELSCSFNAKEPSRFLSENTAGPRCLQNNPETPWAVRADNCIEKKRIGGEDTVKRQSSVSTCFPCDGQPSKNKSILQFQHMLLMPLMAKKHKRSSCNGLNTRDTANAAHCTLELRKEECRTNCGSCPQRGTCYGFPRGQDEALRSCHFQEIVAAAHVRFT